jgi:hypothetical protein
MTTHEHAAESVAADRLDRQYILEADPRIRNGVRATPGLDARSAGGHVVAPPGAHPSGLRHRRIATPGEADLATAPEWLVALLEAVEPPAPELAAALSTATRRQVTRLAAIAGTACHVRRGPGA